MSLPQSVLDLRPLSGHACTDLGFALARRWYWPLIGLYLLVLAPLALVGFSLAVVWPAALTLVPLVLWWLKPLGELALLHWCSQSLFGGAGSSLASARSAYAALPRLLLNYLGPFRLSPTRGLSLCVVFLEKTPLGKGRRRLDVLNGSGSALSWTTVVGVHVEGILALGAYLVLLFLAPLDGPQTESFAALGRFAFLDALQGQAFLLCVIAAQVVFAPFYACASFVHYIHRRSRLEAWDIQHAFGRLNQRVASGREAGAKLARAACVAVLGGVLLTVTLAPGQVLAADPQQAREQIDEILQQERFGHYDDSGRLSWREREEAEVDEEGWDLSWLESLFEGLDSEGFKTFGSVLLLLLALALGYVLLRLLWPSARELFEDLRAQSASRPAAALALPPATFARARELQLQGETRAALSCLLLAVLQAARQRDGLQIPDSFTESECEALLATKLDAGSQQAFADLLALWRQTAYAGRAMPPLYSDRVLQACETAFAEEGA